MTLQELFEAYSENVAARIAFGFTEAEAKRAAFEDTAWTCETSISEVCKAVSIARQNGAHQ